MHQTQILLTHRRSTPAWLRTIVSTSVRKDTHSVRNVNFYILDSMNLSEGYPGYVLKMFLYI